MTGKRFIFIHDNVGLNLKTPIMDGDKKMNIGEVLNEMNALYEENERLVNRVIECEAIIYALKKRCGIDE